MAVSFFFFSSRRRHTRLQGDWSSDVCSSDLGIRINACSDKSINGKYVIGCSGRQKRLVVEVIAAQFQKLFGGPRRWLLVNVRPAAQETKYQANYENLG